MSNYSNYTKNQNEDKNRSSASRSSGKNCLIKGTSLCSLNSLIKVSAVTLVILALQYSHKNECGPNGKCLVSGLESRNARNLSQMNPNFGGSRDNLHFPGENMNERRNNYNNGNFNNPWGSYENLESPSHYDSYYGREPSYMGEENRNEININQFNSGLGQKLKENAIYIVPGMIASYYAWNSLGTQTFLMVAAIIGVLLFAKHNNSN
ncbi:Plasmodium exported protein, unknown function [Plasmodium knowlesi strain H]|uniref:Uncharacterized protein n=3 Tax=Plasmodium knowlesi TaxID=5850 RepID=A0A1A7W3I3_PLAKH|nr:Plasmodium exported protein, unknown function [Plasmodium knowlesi strain H]OTN64205.1 Uncharacterized protein PKNOH_S140218500 [Plasmodium knowlesi]CAA9990613.1 Plasmodium exported protein, unknown function [Plasmodium knowlesi strain H]SBO26055.1 Plasmodium exported protein, unknown function [Plasmodium knowlesi strain H]SBO28746.1 Plasmodium exported protein, unknown function [Plasmodium knowlesi strain H]VVS80087.1 Plasmodium exported protein, unknown function [Plasmodium knowlesi strai